jgi:hypothetical protein
VCAGASRAGDGLGLKETRSLNSRELTYCDCFPALLTVVAGHRCRPYLTVMAMPIRFPPQRPTAELSTATLVDLSLRNHLCFLAMRTEHGSAFHLGTIVRTMFASFFLFDAGFGTGEISTFTQADLHLGEAAESLRPDRPWSLRASAVEPTAKLLQLYDNQLQTAPLVELVKAHQCAERNFKAPCDERLSIAALVQRTRREARECSFPGGKHQRQIDPIPA